MSAPDRKPVAAALSAARKAGGFTLRDVAELCGVSVSVVWKVESDTITPSARYLADIAPIDAAALFAQLAGEEVARERAQADSGVTLPPVRKAPRRAA